LTGVHFPKTASSKPTSARYKEITQKILRHIGFGKESGEEGAAMDGESLGAVVVESERHSEAECEEVRDEGDGEKDAAAVSTEGVYHPEPRAWRHRRQQRQQQYNDAREHAEQSLLQIRAACKYMGRLTRLRLCNSLQAHSSSIPPD